MGFEPTLEFPLNTLSKRAPSTTRPSLLSRVVLLEFITVQALRSASQWNSRTSDCGIRVEESEIVYFQSWLIYSSALNSALNLGGAQERGSSNVWSSLGVTCFIPGLALSASSLVARSAWGRTAALMSGYPDRHLPRLWPRLRRASICSSISAGSSPWAIGADPARDLGFGNGQGDFAKTGEFEFAKAKFDDSKWRTLNLPHDWAVELPFVRDEVQTCFARLQAARTALSRDERRLVPA